MQMTRGIVLLVLTQGLIGCGSNGPASPTSTITPTTTAGATVTRVAITGNVTLARIGETTQLTATATLSDNTTKDVTSDGNWYRGDPRIVTISASGLVTVAGFGSTWISFTYQSRGAGTTVTATLPGTFVIAGRVREPGAGGFANLLVVDTLSGRSATTDSDGFFSLAELPRVQAHFKIEKEGYEPVEKDATATNVDLPLQRVVRLTVGETAQPDALAPNDLSYTVDGRSCQPCRLIRVVVPQAGTVHVHVTWTLTSANLGLFVDGQVVAGATRELTADVPSARRARCSCTSERRHRWPSTRTSRSKRQCASASRQEGLCDCGGESSCESNAWYARKQ